jgi:hypothetical protein
MTANPLILNTATHSPPGGRRNFSIAHNLLISAGCATQRCANTPERSAKTTFRCGENPGTPFRSRSRPYYAVA